MAFIKEIITDLEILSVTQVRLPAGSRLTVGGYQVNQKLPLVMDITTLGLGGLDIGSVQASTLYYIYLVVNTAGVRGLVASVNSSAPTSFNAYRRVGSIHTDASSDIVLTGSANDAAQDSTIGDYRESDLTEAEFQSLNGPGWILADGRNVSGSRYHLFTGKTVVPDARGVVLRGKNNGRADGNQNPDGELALGAFQGHQIQSHTHQWQHLNDADSNTTSAGGDGGGSTITKNTLATGGNETRMKNITVNIFIRIN